MDVAAVFIKNECLKSAEANPVALAERLMQDERIPMHGPIHHILDGSCFLTALHNAGMHFDLEAALDEMAVRGAKMPGATCGQWGLCGSATSLGAALAIVHETGPLSHNEYYKDNLRLVSQALARIAEIGGPRCCKRNAFLSLTTAVNFVRSQYGAALPLPEIICRFSDRNAQCLGLDCPFFDHGQKI